MQLSKISTLVLTFAVLLSYPANSPAGTIKLKAKYTQSYYNYNYSSLSSVGIERVEWDKLVTTTLEITKFKKDSSSRIKFQNKKPAVSRYDETVHVHSHKDEGIGTITFEEKEKFIKVLEELPKRKDQAIKEAIENKSDSREVLFNGDKVTIHLIAITQSKRAYIEFVVDGLVYPIQHEDNVKLLLNAVRQIK